MKPGQPSPSGGATEADGDWWSVDAVDVERGGPTGVSGRSAALRVSALRIVAGLAIALVVWWLGSRLAAAVVVVATFVVSLIAVVSPSAGGKIDAAIARATEPLGRLITTVLLAAVYFGDEILPPLGSVSVRAMAAAIGLSTGYCSLVRRSDSIPHPMYRDQLRATGAAAVRSTI